MVSGFPNKTIELSDGRQLGYAEYGSLTGQVVMYFHPHPGSRISANFMSEMAEQQNILIVAPDRPGCGISEFKSERTFLDWPQDILELADYLGVEKFAVLGASGGGPYAAVCAKELPQRVTNAGLLAPVGPMDVAGSTVGMEKSNRIMFGIAKYAPRLIPYMLSSMKNGVYERPDTIIEQTKQSMLAIDVQFMDEGNHWSWFIEDLQEAFRSGIRGPAWDVRLYAQSWRFRLEDIQIPVYLWQGEQDTNAPPSMGKYMARAIPNCDAKFLPDFGHLSVILGKAEEALVTLCE